LDGWNGLVAIALPVFSALNLCLIQEPMAESHHFSKIAERLVADLRRIASDDPPRAKRRETQSLAPLVEQLLQKHEIGRDSPQQTIRDNWIAVVGATNAAYSHPAAIERNQLIVIAAHAVVRNELFHHRDEIVSRLRKLPGCAHVKAIHLRPG
jgi:hypothetical protein